MPVHKSGNINAPQNHRGIAVSTCLSKIFIILLTDRIDQHMTEKGLWNRNQRGFKKDSKNNLFILQTAINQRINIENEPLYTCFVYFSKFFDTVDRDLLFYKMLKYGISGDIYRIIK